MKCQHATFARWAEKAAAHIRFFDAAGNEIEGGETVFARALLQGG